MIKTNRHIPVHTVFNPKKRQQDREGLKSFKAEQLIFLLWSVTLFVTIGAGSWLPKQKNNVWYSFPTKQGLTFYRHPAQSSLLCPHRLISPDIGEGSLLSVCLHLCSRAALLEQILIVDCAVVFNSSWWPLSPATCSYVLSAKQPIRIDVHQTTWSSYRNVI